jgi:DNA-binding NtrC family response regulator
VSEGNRRRILLVDLPEALADGLIAATTMAADWRRVAAAEVDVELDHWAPDVMVVGTVDDDASRARVAGWCASVQDCEAVVIRPAGSGTTSAWLRAGAFAALTLPIEDDALAAEVERASERRVLRSENRQLRRQLDGAHRFPAVVGTGKKMRELLDLVEAVADSEANILILGENGTGKEVIANAIHTRSRRANGPFIKINCAAIPKELIESELFGHRKGAFTGAVGDRQGLLGMADGGSLLLDEIGEMPSYLQAKLLRVLQEREYRPVGSERIEQVDFRLLCSTNVDVESALKDGRLREDLYFRINTITVRVPALRDRLEDLAPLCQHFIQQFNARHDRQVRGISPAAFQRLMRHHWPGNVRELENVIERGVLVARGTDIDADDLPDTLTELVPSVEIVREGIPSHMTLAEIERLAILQTLQRTNWNKQEAAQLLGLYRPTLYSKMRRYGIETPPRVRTRRAGEARTVVS